MPRQNAAATWLTAIWGLVLSMGIACAGEVDSASRAHTVLAATQSAPVDGASVTDASGQTKGSTTEKKPSAVQLEGMVVVGSRLPAAEAQTAQPRMTATPRMTSLVFISCSVSGSRLRCCFH